MTSFKSSEDKQINHDRFSKLPDNGDPWAPDNLLGAKEKQLNPVGLSNRQEAPAQFNLNG